MELAVQAFAEWDVAGREQRLEVTLDCLPEEMEFERWPRVISSGTGYQAMNDIKKGSVLECQGGSVRL